MKDIQAFPTYKRDGAGFLLEDGMTLLDYACIKLKVPETDKEWLNKLIEKSRRGVFAGQALVGELSSQAKEYDYQNPEECVGRCYEFADAMLKARES